MAEVKQPRQRTENEYVVERAKDFWTRYNRPILIACAAIILLGGGWLVYKYMFMEPREKKAQEAIFKAEEYFRMDSLRLAMNGDGQYPGFDRVISQYGGTRTGNLARFYAGTISLRLKDYNKAVRYLKEFDTDSRPARARKFKLLADAYASLGQNTDALSNYKKAAKAFEEDRQSSSEYLFMAAFFADQVMNNQKEAIDLYRQVMKKFPNTQYSSEAEKHLARNNVFKLD